MEDSEANAMRLLIMQAVSQCTDPDLLDLIYKILVYDTIRC